MRDRTLLIVRMPFEQRSEHLDPRLHVLQSDVLEHHRHAIADANNVLALVGREHPLPFSAAVIGLADEFEPGPLRLHGPDLLFNSFHSGRCPPPSRVAGLAAVVRGTVATVVAANPVTTLPLGPICIRLASISCRRTS